jgi:hypothetical protein
MLRAVARGSVRSRPIRWVCQSWERLVSVDEVDRQRWVGVLSERRYLLKPVGSSDDPMVDDWPDSAPQELSYVHFPAKGRPGVRPGDYLVYYASGTERIVGIVEVFTPPTKDSGEKRWPWRCAVRPRLIIRRIHRSPALDVMSGPERDLRKSVRQQSHIEITEEECLRGREALEEAFDAAQGDLLPDWPMFETKLRA